jgi:anthranilate synthase/aminodeoxychorismate synthase-like glutamine amidotransferase
VIKKLAGSVPILGVCLGHQAIGEVFGGTVVRAPLPVHGKAATLHHDGQGIFRGLVQDIRAARYHSLVVDQSTIPKCLQVSATSRDGLVMALRHRELPIEGVQFHPESILTGEGRKILRNFLEDTP